MTWEHKHSHLACGCLAAYTEPGISHKCPKHGKQAVVRQCLVQEMPSPRAAPKSGTAAPLPVSPTARGVGKAERGGDSG